MRRNTWEDLVIIHRYLFRGCSSIWHQLLCHALVLSVFMVAMQIIV